MAQAAVDISKYKLDPLFEELYHPSTIEYQKKRYSEAINDFVDNFGDKEKMVLVSTPGRTEICGNHTDHQHGRVIAAAVQLDTIGIYSKTDAPTVTIASKAFGRFEIDLNDLKPVDSEHGTSKSLVKGVLSYFKKEGFKIGGFSCVFWSDVPIGSGLSSSAAYCVSVASALNILYNNKEVDDVRIALSAKYAENAYFDKACGLMDQLSCHVGGFAMMDFADPEKPIVKRLPFDTSKMDVTLCISSIGSGHGDLTRHYDAITHELRSVSNFFGKDVLREVNEEEFYQNLPRLTKELGQTRAILRAIHFFQENQRVAKMTAALKQSNIDEFLSLVKESGLSSWRFLQNIDPVEGEEPYDGKGPTQTMSLALAVSELIIGSKGAVRIHGGGFGGTIQAYVPNALVEEYKTRIDSIFGENSCRVINLRQCGTQHFFLE